MSRLDRLFAKPKAVVIGGETFMFKPINMKDSSLIIDLESETKRGPALVKMIRMTLKDAVPDCTDAELDLVSTEYFKELAMVVAEVNGLKKKDVDVEPDPEPKE